LNSAVLKSTILVVRVDDSDERMADCGMQVRTVTTVSDIATDVVL
jgi:hypothetical protein